MKRLLVFMVLTGMFLTGGIYTARMIKEKSITGLRNTEMRGIYAGVTCGVNNMLCAGTSLCSLAQSGCISGSACGVGKYHEEVQEEFTYHVCEGGHPGKLCYNTSEYVCMHMIPFEDAECKIELLLDCRIVGEGCEGTVAK